LPQSNCQSESSQEFFADNLIWNGQSLGHILLGNAPGEPVTARLVMHHPTQCAAQRKAIQ
jgi:hypothetical protein